MSPVFHSGPAFVTESCQPSWDKTLNSSCVRAVNSVRAGVFPQAREAKRRETCVGDVPGGGGRRDPPAQVVAPHSAGPRPAARVIGRATAARIDDSGPTRMRRSLARVTAV